VRDQIVLYQTKLREITLDISGADVLAMGLKEGPEIGRIIETIKSSLIDGEISSKEDQIKLAQSLLTSR
jgi:tRNA nucleotidyltransferase (CCA-adding enzyme)